MAGFIEESEKQTIRRLNMSSLEKPSMTAPLHSMAPPWGFMLDELYFIAAPLAGAKTADEGDLLARRMAFFARLDEAEKAAALASGPPADYPLPDFYTDDAGDRHSITFDQAPSDTRMRLAHLTSSGKWLCVKFTTRYSAEAHRAAHRLGVAPALYAVNTVGEWTMVVMEDMSESYAPLWYLKENAGVPEHKWGKVFGWVPKAVEDKLALLHEAG